MFNFLFSLWWVSLGITAVAVFLCAGHYLLTKDLEDEVLEEESTYKAKSWEFEVKAVRE
jgi:hypothetical protein